MGSCEPLNEEYSLFKFGLMASRRRYDRSMFTWPNNARASALYVINFPNFSVRADAEVFSGSARIANSVSVDLAIALPTLTSTFYMLARRKSALLVTCFSLFQISGLTFGTVNFSQLSGRLYFANFSFNLASSNLEPHRLLTISANF